MFVSQSMSNNYLFSSNPLLPAYKHHTMDSRPFQLVSFSSIASAFHRGQSFVGCVRDVSLAGFHKKSATAPMMSLSAATGSTRRPVRRLIKLGRINGRSESEGCVVPAALKINPCSKRATEERCLTHPSDMSMPAPSLYKRT